MEKRGFFARLFGARKKDEATAKAAMHGPATETGPGSRIHFDDSLIRKLKNDHAELFRLFNEIKTFSESGYLSALPELLTSFRLTLQTHLMLENVKFYAYLQQNFAKDADLMYFISDVKREMDNIAHTVVNFTNYYASQKLMPEKIVVFRTELDDIGEILVKRVALEETRLYTLYMPSY